MKKFAKLFETEEIGQILVTLDYSDEEEEHQLSLRTETDGVKMVSSICFEDKEGSEESARKAFETITETQAAKICKETRERMFSIE